MAILNAPSNGGKVFATISNDIVTGSAFNDTLHGLGGNDIINGNAGDDTIFGEGVFSYAQAFSNIGYANIAFTGATTTTGTGLALTSMGVADGQSIWRIRNSSNVDKVVTFQSASQGTGNNGSVTVTLTIPAKSDIVLPSNNLGTHKLISDGKQIDVKAAGTQVFNSAATMPVVDGNDILNGGNGNDTIDGGGGNDTVNGDGGDDILTGGKGDDVINGGAGNDTLLAEWSVTGDKYDGGSGIDTFKVQGTAVEAFAQEIDLLTGKNNWGDTFANIENIIGGTANDKFYGSAVDNAFWGGKGNDVLDGREGNDKLSGDEGDDTLVGGAGNDLLDGGIGNDILNGGIGADQLIGGDGVDAADYSTSSAGVNVNLTTGAASGGDAEADTLSGIENLTGSEFADVLTGDAKANLLNAGAGNDIVIGSGGGDTIDGGSGLDLINYAGSNAAVSVDLKTGKGVGGWAQSDVISNIENIDGSIFDDVLTGNELANLFNGGLGADRLSGGEGADVLNGNDGNDALFGDAGNDSLFGGVGNDRITGGVGADVINGGDGVDTADYRKSDGAVDVSLMRGTGILADAEGDTLQFIENLSGSAFSDILVGDNNVNRITGMSGEDKIYGMGGNDYIATGGGYDFVDGGDGIDTVTYEDSWDRVVVNLTTGKNQYGEASRDVLTNVENIIGSVYNDTITGDGAANRLTGGDGTDVLSGMGGNDYIYGGNGADRMTGGTGADVFVFNAGFGNDTITDFEAGPGRGDRIWLQGAGAANQASTAWSVADSAAGAVITIVDHGSITLTGVTVAQLNADDFIFS
jgi:Ca2+-binding RTX toxin-like protein